jgi:hypothetical protein
MEELLMRAALVVAMAFAAYSSFPLTAQRHAPTEQQTLPEQQPGSLPASETNLAQAVPSVDGSANTPAEALKPVSGELMGKLDSQSAKTGDSVMLKTKENVRTADGTEIPKGSKIVGTVTGVQAHGGSAQNSQIAVKFDRAELKSGQSVAIESVIQSVAPAEGDAGNNANTYGASMTGPLASGGSSGAQPSGTGANMSHDAMNGNLGAANREGAQASLPPGLNTTRSSASSGPAPGTIVARNGDIAIRATAVPGVLIANTAKGLPFANASSILLGAKRDVHLDVGTLMVIAVATMSNGGTAGGMSR